jgi:hypothetical protein
MPRARWPARRWRGRRRRKRKKAGGREGEAEGEAGLYRLGTVVMVH